MKLGSRSRHRVRVRDGAELARAGRVAAALRHRGAEEPLSAASGAKGLEMPCFALTGPDAGSDAGAIPDFGIVCRGMHEGREVLGIRVTWEKRYITLGPVATLLGLAFRCTIRTHLLGKQRGHRHHARADSDQSPGREYRPPPLPAERLVHERAQLGQGRVHSDGLGDRRQALRRTGLAHADGVPRRGSLHLAAVFHHRRCEDRLRAPPARTAACAASSAFRSASSKASRKRSRASAAISTRWTRRAS